MLGPGQYTSGGPIRPHESPDFVTPLSRYLADPNESSLFEPERVQEILTRDTFNLA